MKINLGKFPTKGNRRKIDVKIDSYDTWNLDHSLALIIYPALLQLKATKHGIPSELVDDVGGEDYVSQDSFDFYKETHQESWEIASKRWDEILEKMIWSFRQICIDDYGDLYHHGKMDMDWIESDKTYPNPVTGVVEPTYQMVDKDPNSHWFDAEGHQLHEERIQEGLSLFGKYYRSLWD